MLRLRSRGLTRSVGLTPVPAWVTTDNLFTAPTDINNAAWTKERLNPVGNDAISGPYAGTFADLLTEDTTITNTHQARQSITYNASTVYLQRAVVKSNGRDLTLLFSSTTHGSTQQAYFQLTTGNVNVTGGSPTASMTDLGSGWWLCAIQATSAALGSPTAANTIIRLAQYPSTQSYTGDGASGIYVFAVGLHVVS